MIEGDIVDESEPAKFSTLCKEVRTAMRKLLKAMPSLCFIHDFDIRNLEKKLELIVRKDLTENVNSVPSDFLDNARRHQNNHLAEDDVFGAIHTKGMAKILGDKLELGSHRLVFCSTVQFDLCYNGFAKKNYRNAS